MSGEFDLIRRYFSHTQAQPDNMARRAGVILGVADDCAIFTSPQGKQIATSTDLLVEGRHFFSDVNPYALGHKALAVNLSDLAAMGAKPIGCLLGLALPRIDEDWLQRFSQGFYHLSNKMACPLIGGDTTRSEQGVTISVTVFGEVTPPYLTRSAAQVGDVIWVSGYLGDAHIALECLLKQHQGQTLNAMELHLLERTRSALEYPQPRISLGLALHGLAHAMLDISDGLLQDLGHILSQSQVCAKVYEEKLPVSPHLLDMDVIQRRKAVLAGGDVYELCFTAPASATGKLHALSHQLAIPLTPIGEICANKEGALGGLVAVVDAQGQPVKLASHGFDHFAPFDN
ncbi:thiamine-phosphate kinase [Pelistega europaea]|uniref:Thiamine-monophosphate kinase n=1 Tax=Pelistega europaea TaxID=106147 RepID=A0A7Y4LE19_9BURK|nr:thiamine-phosphate kinase [Pelistega europaea]